MALRISRLALAGEYNNRLGVTTKDRRYKNVMFDISTNESGEKVVSVVKRPGMSESTAVTAAAGRGIYHFKSNIYTVIGNKLYKDGVQLGSNLTNSTGLVHFTEEHKTDLLIIQDGDKLIKTNGTTVTELTDAQIPTGQVDGIVNLNTYVLTMNSDGEIYNSDLDDVTNWTSGNFITAKFEPDDGVALLKSRNYVVALGAWSTEFFYDAANASGSPLSPAEGRERAIGCAAGDTVYSEEDIAVWVSRTRTGASQVVTLSGNDIKPLSTPEIDRILIQEETALDAARAFGMRVSGHLLYVLTLPTLAITLVCDVETGLWGEWTSDPGTESYFTGIGYAYMDGKHYVLDEDNGKVYTMDFDIYQDDSNDINVEIVTSLWEGGKYDGNTARNKFLHRVTLIGDKQTSTSNVTFQMTTDDYTTWSTARTIDMSKAVPSATQFGKLQRAGFRLQHAANTPFRIQALELAYTLGGYEGGNA